MKSNKNQRLQRSMTHYDLKTKKNELSRSSFKQHSFLHVFFVYGYPICVAEAAPPICHILVNAITNGNLRGVLV